MRVFINKSSVKGEVFAPPSKSYTHRAITLAALSKESTIHRPLLSGYPSQHSSSRMFGAKIEEKDEDLIIHGFNGKPNVPEDVSDAANQGQPFAL